ncbi:acetate/propionate family kinase [Mesobacterium sp. TK19101]|uniref:Acetate kinase n=1 Tax=Mesobacterium hydrothermale TaxID=3111907 RepID=A0ABU6HJL8_9RHOB|nr:acetate/propionate family kinase [Mesobacterium sp. TK19101]MEC3861320.1 acetate/propionate family kinase [Mesobacterium sp. TK19101]
MKDRVLVLNAGSSSIKFAVFDRDLTETISGLADCIGGASRLKIGACAHPMPLADHRAALSAILTALEHHGVSPRNLSAAAHRVVHGGQTLTTPMRVTPAVLAEIRRCIPLAPLHNPNHLAAIEILAESKPDLPQFVSFDTAFHASNPAVAMRYAIPKAQADKGIRRYGFHGSSYASLVERLPELSGHPLPRRLLAFHLGNGASICAIRDGKSVATTMGYSPLDGLTMGTRSGGIDANAVLRMVEEEGLARTRTILNTESGLAGLSGGLSDMRALTQDPGPAAAFAIDHFCYWAQRYAGSLIAAMQGVDAIAFTGGIGENAAQIRARICDGLSWLGLRLDPGANRAGATRLQTADSQIAAWIVPAEEERKIAADALSLMEPA